MFPWAFSPLLPLHRPLTQLWTLLPLPPPQSDQQMKKPNCVFPSPHIRKVPRVRTREDDFLECVLFSAQSQEGNLIFVLVRFFRIPLPSHQFDRTFWVSAAQKYF